MKKRELVSFNVNLRATKRRAGTFNCLLCLMKMKMIFTLKDVALTPTVPLVSSLNIPTGFSSCGSPVSSNVMENKDPVRLSNEKLCPNDELLP